METFNAIGLAIPKEKTLNDLAEDARKRGEQSHSLRLGGTLHGRCWRIGLGLEVWTIHYESQAGDVFYADCRPGFRARCTEDLSVWSLFESEEKGAAFVEGCTEKSGVKVLFQLQNLTEVGAGNFNGKFLTVALGGLARRAEVSDAAKNYEWLPLRKTAGNRAAGKSDWRLRGRVLNFKLLCNPFSGKNLYWIHLDLDDFELEILVNQQTLRGGDLHIGATVEADVWLQGHIIRQSTFYLNYEGIDWSSRPSDFWRKFKRLN